MRIEVRGGPLTIVETIYNEVSQRYIVVVSTGHCHHNPKASFSNNTDASVFCAQYAAKLETHYASSAWKNSPGGIREKYKHKKMRRVMDLA